ncbi:hypothetical protein FSARC_7638 [Fusarium sarcochroum]|uniref:Uncharacterized protein n=1 Tax=Fusarium sarcochroum TaxID=1208366 RepID=A0A8H4TUU6_9HYPO|nr:hypothetical protein FSARC_7638 [Fusarium sarcochroum]
MAGKDNNEKPLWRPLAHKLSSLIPRRRSGKAKSKVDASPLGQHSQNSASDFRPLEVQSNALEGLHLPNNWLVEPPNFDKQGQQSPSPVGTSPIAHQYAPQSAVPTIDHLETQNPPELYHFDHHEDTQPLTIPDVSEAAEKEQVRASTLATLTTVEISTERSVLDRGRPIEARHLIHQPNKTLKNRRKSLPLEFELLTQLSNEDHASDSQHTSTIGSVPKIEAATSPSTKESSTWDADRRRRSTIRLVTRSPSPAATKVAPAVSTPKTLQIPTDGQSALKRHSYQSLPKFAAAGVTAANTAASPQPTSAPRIKTKQPGSWNDRLAWIRKLEEKENTRPNIDSGRLPKRAGTVSDKLAMFEKKNLSTAAPTKRLQPPTRTNSGSHCSATGRESIFSADSNASAPSPRTSVDTARTNNRASSVMSYYDDSFREKLETLVGQEPEMNKVDELHTS